MLENAGLGSSESHNTRMQGRQRNQGSLREPQPHCNPDTCCNAWLGSIRSRHVLLKASSGLEAESWQADIKMNGQQARNKNNQTGKNRSIGNIQAQI